MRRWYAASASAWCLPANKALDADGGADVLGADVLGRTPPEPECRQSPLQAKLRPALDRLLAPDPEPDRLKPGRPATRRTRRKPHRAIASRASLNDLGGSGRTSRFEPGRCRHRPDRRRTGYPGATVSIRVNGMVRGSRDTWCAAPPRDPEGNPSGELRSTWLPPRHGSALSDQWPGQHTPPRSLSATRTRPSRVDDGNGAEYQGEISRDYGQPPARRRRHVTASCQVRHPHSPYGHDSDRQFPVMTNSATTFTGPPRRRDGRQRRAGP